MTLPDSHHLASQQGESGPEYRVESPAAEYAVSCDGSPVVHYHNHNTQQLYWLVATIFLTYHTTSFTYFTYTIGYPSFNEQTDLELAVYVLQIAFNIRPSLA